jgi:hypothetical protein
MPHVCHETRLTHCSVMLSTGGSHRLHAELALRNIQSIQRFDKNSSRVARYSLILNLAMLAISILAMCISLRAYRAAERSAGQQQATLDASRTALERVLSIANEGATNLTTGR